MHPVDDRNMTEIRTDHDTERDIMINWNDLKNLDVKDFDFSKIDLGNIDFGRFDVRNFDVSSVNLPKFDVPKFDLPEIDVPVDVDRVAGFARDAAYASVGAVVITVQKVDERRRELTNQVTTQVRKLVDAVA